MTVDAASNGARRLHGALPIFRLAGDGNAVFYAPGHPLLVPEERAAQVEEAVMSGTPAPSPDADAAARQLEEHGRAALRAWRALSERPFDPECLTLVLSNRCDLACEYCYTAAGRYHAERMPAERRSGRLAMPHGPAGCQTLSETVAGHAMRAVARRCAAASKPFVLVYHGGGEPTIEWELLVRLHAVARKTALQAGTRLWTHVSTHGAIDEGRARWLAEHIDDIGLSCDGPPDIQDAQRPWPGPAPRRGTSALVERTARILADAGTHFTVRATVTPATIDRQRDIVDYACGTLEARRIRVEPVHRAGQAGGQQFLPSDAERFVRQYARAAEAARQYGCELHTSGARSGDIHGPYCNVLRNVVQLGPEGALSGCFVDSVGALGEGSHSRLGMVGMKEDGLVIVDQRAAELRRRAATVPERCAACINVYHCARGCPDVCLSADGGGSELPDGFRCRMQRQLSAWSIREIARSQVPS